MLRMRMLPYYPPPSNLASTTCICREGAQRLVHCAVEKVGAPAGTTTAMPMPGVVQMSGAGTPCTPTAWPAAARAGPSNGRHGGAGGRPEQVAPVAAGARPSAASSGAMRELAWIWFSALSLRGACHVLGLGGIHPCLDGLHPCLQPENLLLDQLVGLRQVRAPPTACAIVLVAVVAVAVGSTVGAGVGSMGWIASRVNSRASWFGLYRLSSGPSLAVW